MSERLQKRIAAAGLMSRRAAEERIAAGRVTVNGRVARLGEQVEETDEIRVDGRLLPRGDDKVYIMLNKPRGYVTTLHDEKGRRDVTELLDGLGTRVYPVGRLDMDSEGLLLLTNDGDFANALMHPSREVEKRYEVQVRGEVTEDTLEVLRQPMELDGYTIRPARVERLATLPDGARLAVTIHEGRNLQVRRMCERVGLSVARLRRVSEGSLRLGKLRTGCWRPLSEAELAALRREIWIE